MLSRGPEAAPPPALNESDAYERPYPRLTENNGLPNLDETLSEKIRFILLASLEDTDARKRVLISSISTQAETSRDDDMLPGDLGFELYSFCTDDLWPGLDMYPHGNDDSLEPEMAQGEIESYERPQPGDYATVKPWDARQKADVHTK